MPCQSGFLIQFIRLAGPFWNSGNKAIIRKRMQLEQAESWEKALTREQQQRLGLVRLFLYRPKWILLQEAFDSLDPEGEELMLRLICQELPEAAMLTITNQPTAEAFHDRELVL